MDQPNSKIPMTAWCDFQLTLLLQQQLRSSKPKYEEKTDKKEAGDASQYDHVVSCAAMTWI